ncbi:MAG: hypothetical protein Q7S58_16175 [Candidatus Binatus sp.]|uniref:hypothetical protein n=1 Tax=Candidatus Binatus sp. TaxID=2811406 RepID=UPI0027176B8B|nr:hypothetical protein [Candidatus Binatus sp.]MDO8433936.1 hypothetical protein [Candidatus Binatus sp.]
MKPGHAAALALVGWYLMLGAPPAKEGVRNYDAPMSQWVQVQAYDSAADCEADRTRRWYMCDQQGDKAGAKLWFDAKCVTTDDPRLKAK